MDRGRAIFLLVWAAFALRYLVFSYSCLLAIRFVLSDAYTSMSREERQALLHEGISTTTTLSAYGPCPHITNSNNIS
jgi:hypothetical protein